MRARHSAKTLAFFATAFVPAWVILLVRYAFSGASPEICLLLALLTAAAPVSVVVHLCRESRASTDLVPIDVKKKSDITGDVAIYTLAYVPIALFEDLAPANLAVFLIIMVVVYSMYTRFNLLHINPVVSMLYRTYRVVDDHGNTVVVLSRLKVRAGPPLPCREISENLYIVTADSS